jgi:uncharacterized membrane protein HdeD (DUF308 family)
MPQGGNPVTLADRNYLDSRGLENGAPDGELTRQGTEVSGGAPDNAFSSKPRTFRLSPPPRTSSPRKRTERRTRYWDDIGRVAEILLGLFSVGFAVVVLAQPQLSLTGLVVLLGEAVALFSAQTVLAGGRVVTSKEGWLRGPGSLWHTIRSWGIVGVGLLAIGLTAFAVLDPSLALTTVVFALALALLSGGFGRILQSSGESLPHWLRGSTLTTGLFSVLLVGISVAFYGFAIATFAILVGIILLISGIETVVTGLRPTDARQFVLLRLLLFSAFYGLILINWIDLFGKQVPAYGIWLILTYMAPFGVLMVFQGWKSWPLAISLGLLVSLFNDVGYFFIGNLIFGFHEPLGPWIAGQLGFDGSRLVTIFQGGSFHIDVTSWMMGFSIYARAAVVGLILYHWWRHPGGIVAATAQPAPASPG